MELRHMYTTINNLSTSLIDSQFSKMEISPGRGYTNIEELKWINTYSKSRIYFVFICTQNCEPWNFSY